MIIIVVLIIIIIIMIIIIIIRMEARTPAQQSTEQAVHPTQQGSMSTVS